MNKKAIFCNEKVPKRQKVQKYRALTYGSVCSSDICMDSSDEAETKSTGSSVDSSHPVIHSAYMMNASGENDDRSDGEDSSGDDAQDDASVDSDKYYSNKLMMF